MQKITPFLWFEKDMKKVTDFYLSVFPGSKIKSSGGLDNTPSGQVSTATIEICGLDFNFMTAGPYLPFKPTVSFIISCDSIAEVDTLWKKLSTTGKILMELSTYPFAEKFGWVQDQYGVSWQIMFSSQMKSSQKVVPTLMFAGTACGRAEEAVNFYTSVFHNSKINYLIKYGPEDTERTEKKAIVKHAGFTIENSPMALMDSGRPSPPLF